MIEPIELRNSTGALDFSRITPQIIEALDEPQQRALLALMHATEAKEAATVRRNAATRRVNDAIADEDVKRAAHEDASSPLPFAPVSAKLEAELGRDLRPHEVLELREKHAARVRAIKEQAARQAVVAAYNKSSH